MIERHFVTGLGGVGKSLVARALAEVIPDAVLVDLEHRRALPDGIWHPIQSLDDWITLHDCLAEEGVQDGAPLVIGFPEFWSLPEASRVMGLEAMCILSAKPVWVVGRPGSAAALRQALEWYPSQMHEGIVARNRYFGLREYLHSPVRQEMREDGYIWSEIDIPALHPLLVESSNWGHPMAQLYLGFLERSLAHVGS